MKRVAVVGAGPAGAYAVAGLLASRARPHVDLYERLPTPWGLLRAGVAPDHQEIKVLQAMFDELAERPRCRFFGNVEPAHEVLARHYDAIVYAVGARSNKALGIDGEDLPGSMPATEFVGWYNGHPDRRDVAPDLSHPRAVVIGNGNVAADVARLLLRSPDELARTDIADHALEGLRAGAVEEVVVLGRRGPAQAAFTSAELDELGRLDGVDVSVAGVRPPDAGAAPDEADDPAASGDPAAPDDRAKPGDPAWRATTFTSRRNVALLRGYAAREPTGAPRRLVLRFLSSPVAIRGDGRVEAIDVARTELVDEDGTLRAKVTDDVETLECGLVLRSVGYRAVPLPGVPFDEQAYVIPNEAGRVVGAPGVYAVGWIKRGPTGILGTNKRDAAETVRAVVADLEAGVTLGPQARDADPDLPGAVAWAGWRAIDRAERDAGEAQDRPRVKFTTVDDLLSAVS